MDAKVLRSNFFEEQGNLQKYIEYLQLKTAIFEKDLRELHAILHKYNLLKDEKNKRWLLWNKPYGVGQLGTVQIFLDEAKQITSVAIKDAESTLQEAYKPEGLDSIDARSFEGELIQFMLNEFEEDASPDNINIAREDAILQLIEIKEETGSDESIEKDVIDFSIKCAIYLLKSRKYYDLVFVNDRIEEIEISLRMIKPETEINVLRQGFILLMTIFDATVFDLMRVALRKDFFKLIGIFGKQDKVSLESFGKYDDFEKFKEETIEDQLKTKYLKDIFSILESQHVEYITANGHKPIHLKEMVQRRNIHIHNRGRVDDKYLEKDNNGIPRYNIYNLKSNSIAHVDVEYWNMVNLLCRNCVENLANWIDLL